MLVALPGGRAIEVSSIVLSLTMSMVAVPWKDGLGVKVTVAIRSIPLKGLVASTPGGCEMAKKARPVDASISGVNGTVYSAGVEPKKLSAGASILVIVSWVGSYLRYICAPEICCPPESNITSAVICSPGADVSGELSKYMSAVDSICSSGGWVPGPSSGVGPACLMARKIRPAATRARMIMKIVVFLGTKERIKYV